MNNPLFHLSIRIKIIASSVLMVLLISLFIFMYYTRESKSQIHQAMQQKDHGVAEMIAIGVGFGIGSGDFEMVTEALNWAKQDSSFTGGGNCPLTDAANNAYIDPTP